MTCSAFSPRVRADMGHEFRRTLDRYSHVRRPEDLDWFTTPIAASGDVHGTLSLDRPDGVRDALLGPAGRRYRIDVGGWPFAIRVRRGAVDIEGVIESALGETEEEKERLTALRVAYILADLGFLSGGPSGPIPRAHVLGQPPEDYWANDYQWPPLQPSVGGLEPCPSLALRRDLEHWADVLTGVVEAVRRSAGDQDPASALIQRLAIWSGRLDSPPPSGSPASARDAQAAVAEEAARQMDHYLGGTLAGWLALGLGGAMTGGAVCLLDWLVG